MAIELYCWRCRTVVPMLDESEFARLEPLLSTSVRNVKRYREKHAATIEMALLEAEQPALEEYFRVTGYRETNVNRLYHHRMALFGPPCGVCARPLRTPRANYCAACGAPRTDE